MYHLCLGEGQLTRLSNFKGATNGNKRRFRLGRKKEYNKENVTMITKRGISFFPTLRVFFSHTVCQKTFSTRVAKSRLRKTSNKTFLFPHTFTTLTSHSYMLQTHIQYEPPKKSKVKISEMRSFHSRKKSLYYSLS